jgi:hypothetical protein
MILQDLKILFQESRKYDQKGHFVIVFSDVTKNLFYDKRCVFSKESTWWRKVAEVGQKMDFRAFCSEI